MVEAESDEIFRNADTEAVLVLIDIKVDEQSKENLARSAPAYFCFALRGRLTTARGYSEDSSSKSKCGSLASHARLPLT